jgi:hypothetical protein
MLEIFFNSITNVVSLMIRISTASPYKALKKRRMPTSTSCPNATTSQNTENHPFKSSSTHFL